MIDEADVVCFTGSTPTGKQVAAQAAGKLTYASLELGGKNPMIVLDDVNPAQAAAAAVYACFSSMGQLCVSDERIFVQRAVADEFIAEFVKRTKELKQGPALDYSTDVGALTLPSQVERVQEHVDDAVKKGATVLAGGRIRDDLGPNFYEPTVLTGVTPDMSCFANETFGPVVWIQVVDTEDEAVAAANDSPYGLNASVFSSSPPRAFSVAERIDAGSVNINEGYRATFSSADAPMGGMKESGLGRRNGPEGLARFVESRTIARATGLLTLPQEGRGVREARRADDAAAEDPEGRAPQVARPQVDSVSYGAVVMPAAAASAFSRCWRAYAPSIGLRTFTAGSSSSMSASRMMRRGSYCRGSSFFQSMSSKSGPISSRMRSFAPFAIDRSDLTKRASWDA